MKFLAKNLRHLGKKGIPLDNGLIHTLSKQERFLYNLLFLSDHYE